MCQNENLLPTLVSARHRTQQFQMHPIFEVVSEMRWAPLMQLTQRNSWSQSLSSEEEDEREESSVSGSDPLSDSDPSFKDGDLSSSSKIVFAFVDSSVGAVVASLRFSDGAIN